MDILDISLAASKTKRELEESGRVAKISISKRETTTEVTFAYNEEVDAYMATVEGTLGIKPTDLFVDFTFHTGSSLYEPFDGKLFPVASPLYAGNLSIAGVGEDTGERWLFVVDFEQNKALILTYASVSNSGNSIITNIRYETIHPIDPKFLPNPIVDLDALGLATPALELLNGGGGQITATKNNIYGIDIEEVHQAFPKGRPFVAILDVPGMGFMTVTPVYTLFGANGLLSAHFDSYINSNAGLSKFYVRFTVIYQEGTIVEVAISVGFYT